MGRYEIILGKVPRNAEPEEEAIKKSPVNDEKLKPPGLHTGSWIPNPISALDWASPMSTARRPWMPPPTINEIRTLNRHSFLHDPNVATQIETISYMCFEAVSRTSEENNRLLPRLGYYRFRHFVINSAREFFIIGDVFLMWRNDDLWIMNPDDVHVVQHRENGPGLAYFLNTFTTLSGQMPITSRFRQQETRTRIENVFHLSRRLSSYGMLGSSIMMRYAEDPAVFEIPNVGHEIYVSQFVDAWVNSNIMLS